jgi:catalase
MAKQRQRALLMAGAICLLAGCSPSYEELPLGQEGPGTGEARITAEMIEEIRAISLQRHPDGKLHRFNQVKSVGCFKASFEVLDNLPDTLAKGLFAAPASYPAKLRFANATQMDDRKSDFRGLSIRVRNITGEALWGEPGVQDFVLNSHPRLFVATPADFLDFIKATRSDSVWRYFANPSHFYSLPIVLRGRAKADNLFTTRYWSTTPYRLGAGSDTAVKYSTKICPGKNLKVPVDEHADFLTDAMAAHLSKGQVCLEFMVQPQTDPATMPIENAAIVWDEEVSAFVPVARIYIDQQPFTRPGRMADCERMRFNPWQSLADHQPLGGINRVRKAVYSEVGEFRIGESKRREEL